MTNYMCQNGHTILLGHKCYNKDCNDWLESDRGTCLHCVPCEDKKPQMMICPEFRECESSICDHKHRHEFKSICGWEVLRAESRCPVGTKCALFKCKAEWSESNCLDKDTCPILSDGSICNHAYVEPSPESMPLRGKVVIVTYCGACPHNDMCVSGKLSYPYCNAPCPNRKFIEDGVDARASGIPSWCPLPDAEAHDQQVRKDLIEECIKTMKVYRPSLLDEMIHRDSYDLGVAAQLSHDIAHLRAMAGER